MDSPRSTASSQIWRSPQIEAGPIRPRRLSSPAILAVLRRCQQRQAACAGEKLVEGNSAFGFCAILLRPEIFYGAALALWHLKGPLTGISGLDTDFALRQCTGTFPVSEAESGLFNSDPKAA